MQVRFRRRSRPLTARPERDAAPAPPAAPLHTSPGARGDDGVGALADAVANLQAGIAALTETGRDLTASLEAQTVVLTRLLEALAERDGLPAAMATERRAGVLGGTVDGRRAVHRLDGRTPGTDVEVRCVWDGGWVGGFEVVEILECRDGVRFRLLRRSDRSVLPVLFDDHEVRVAPSVPRPGAGPQLDLTDPDLTGTVVPERDTAVGTLDGHRPRAAGPAPTGPDGPPGTEPAFW